MSDRIYVLNRGEIVILVLAAILIGVIYGVIDKWRGKFKKPQLEDKLQSED